MRVSINASNSSSTTVSWLAVKSPPSMDFTEYAQPRSRVPANDSNPSIYNPMLIYSFLALYGVLTVLILTYVHSKFRLATRTLSLLQTEWQSAESRHKGCAGAAQQQLSKLAEPAPVAALQ